MRSRSIVANIGLLALFLVGVYSSAMADPQSISVFVSILPQKYFVERVGGDLVKVAVLVGPGQSPATYEPTPRQMAELSKAKLFFSVGVPFEGTLLPKIESTFKSLTVVDTRKGIKLRTMTEEDDHAGEEHSAPPSWAFFLQSDDHAGEEHSAPPSWAFFLQSDDHAGEEHSHQNGTKDMHGKEHKPGHHHDGAAEEGHHHEAGSPDPHIWLDPIFVKTQAKTICDALRKIDPQHADVYAKNLKDFQGDLDRVHAKIAKVLAPLKGKTVFVFHPAYGYFTDRYGLKQVAVETGGREPSAKQLAALIDKAKHANVKVIFVQPQFDKKNAQVVAKAIGGAAVSLDPLSPDYLKNLDQMASRIQSAFAAK